MKEIKKSFEQLGDTLRNERIERNLKAQKEREKHMKEMAEKYGVLGNPKFDLAYNLAWSYGHSSGYPEVENYFMELVDLIR